MSVLSIKTLFKPHSDVLAYIQDAGADPEYTSLKQLLNLTKVLKNSLFFLGDPAIPPVELLDRKPLQR